MMPSHRKPPTSTRRTTSRIPGPWCILILMFGCARPGGGGAFERAMTESITILSDTDPEIAARWRTWHSRHSALELLGPDPTGIEWIELPTEFKATAYAAPIIDATPTENDLHRHPILGAPPEPTPPSRLPTRRQYASSPDLRPPVLGWVANGLDAYLAEVNGSVGLRFPGGRLACLDWVRTNQRSYTSLGQRLIEKGHADATGMNLSVIRALHDENPVLVETLMLDNDRVVYFEEIPAERWPQASTGVRLLADHSVAVDPKVIPLGSILSIERAGGEVMIAMAIDIGGAIKGYRIDLFLGTGEESIARAGGVVESVRISVLSPAD